MIIFYNQAAFQINTIQWINTGNIAEPFINTGPGIKLCGVDWILASAVSGSITEALATANCGGCAAAVLVDIVATTNSRLI